jgi:hypothetical protein
MQIFGTVDLNTVQDGENWHVTLSAPAGTKLSLSEASDLGRILREVAHAPAALHRAPAADPTFCEEPV